MLHDLPDIAIAVVFLVAFVTIWRSRDDDPTWNARWRALSPADRARLTAAARSGALVASPEEIELAADSIVFLLFGVIFFLGGLWSLRRTIRISHAERETISRHRPY